MHALLKDRIWLLKIPVVIAFATAFLINEGVHSGVIESAWVRNYFFSPTQWVAGKFTDFKFFIRGKEAVKNPKIVIVDVDNFSIEETFQNKGERWPWHRDTTADVIRKTFEYGAKAVALDIVFSEKDPRVPNELKQALTENGINIPFEQFETDNNLKEVIHNYKDRLVLGWMSPTSCRPRSEGAQECAVKDPEALATIPKNFTTFKVDDFQLSKGFDAQNTDITSAPVVVSSFSELESEGMWAGNFDVTPDVDGIVRRVPLVSFVGGELHPSLGFRMAALALNDNISVKVSEYGKVESLQLMNSKTNIDVSASGVLDINFRGAGRTFTYISANTLFWELDKELMRRELASLGKTDPREVLKDALVFIGVSATGAYDMRAFPYDPNVPGVEGHATILDNLMAKDWLIPSFLSLNGWGTWIIFLFMTVLALMLSYYAQVLEALQAILVFTACFIIFAVLDVFVLFKQFHMNWNTGFFYMEMASVFALSLAAKYFVEEQKRKSLKSAFSKYLSPDMVDIIAKDPDSLTLTGKREELSVLFSDIRSFTSFSEQMDAKTLSAFLNDYLGVMTDIVFKHQGTLDKYIGDAVMAFWGAPVANPKHSSNALLAAQEMMQALNANRERWMKAYFEGVKNVYIDIGVGINTGIVMVGNMGCEKNFEYTVIGDNVNLASRLEGLTKTYHAHILTTRQSLKEMADRGEILPDHRTLDFVKVKGKKVAIELIEILDRPLPRDGLALFDQARVLYTAQKFDEAIAVFNSVLAAFKAKGFEDEICLDFIERCEEFKKNPPAQDWDGAWTMTSK